MIAGVNGTEMTAGTNRTVTDSSRNDGELEPARVQGIEAGASKSGRGGRRLRCTQMGRAHLRARCGGAATG